MRPLGLVVIGVVAVVLASVRVDSWPWPSVGGQSRHSSGIVLLGPIDHGAIREAPGDALRKSWNDAYTLAQEVNPDLFGFPWMDRATGELVISVASPRGNEITAQWVRSGLRVASPKPGGPFTIDLPRPDVTVRVQSVQHSIQGLNRIMDDLIDMARAGVPGANRIYSAGPDPEHDRVVIETDRLNDQLLEVIAARFGISAVAVRIDPRATPMHLL